MAITANSEPQAFHEAIQHPSWQQAIDNELTSLNNNHTWTLTPLLPDKQPISYKWHFKIKYKADGSIEQHKATLVACALTQTTGLDYIETFSLVVKMTTMRLVLSLAASLNWHLHQLDVNTAFLHGDLFEEVYMKILLGLTVSSHNSDQNLECKLHKSLYGLKQASRQWNAK